MRRVRRRIEAVLVAALLWFTYYTLFWSGHYLNQQWEMGMLGKFLGAP